MNERPKVVTLNKLDITGETMKVIPARQNPISHTSLVFAVLFAFALILAPFVGAQTTNQTSQPEGALTKAQGQVKAVNGQGFPLQATTSQDTSKTVADAASIGAVLLPPNITKKVFGKDISDNFVALSLTVSNRSTQNSLIVHSILVDYSRWLLSGIENEDVDIRCGAASSKPATTAATRKTNNVRSRSEGNLLQPSQIQTCPGQISSVEYRIVRDQLLHDQPYTWRNWVVRSLTLAGSIASAYTFPIANQNIIKGISAFSGDVVPAVETFLPDDTVGQMNNISDLAFKVNKVIPAQSSDIIVAFYPIDRFLTPGLAKIFKASPAVFFAPEAMFFDPHIRQQLEPFIEPILPKGWDLNNVLPYYPTIISPSRPCDSKISQADSGLQVACGVHNMLRGVSLNTVRVIVGGTMTVDVDNVPPQIKSVSITNADGSTPVDWTKAGVVDGMIEGSFLTNGQPQIAEADKLGITTIAAVTDDSTDTELHFTMTIPKNMAISTDTSNPTKLTFTVVKKDKQGGNVTSVAYEYTIPVAKSPASAADNKAKAAGAASTTETPPAVTPSGA